MKGKGILGTLLSEAAFTKTNWLSWFMMDWCLTSGIIQQRKCIRQSGLKIKFLIFVGEVSGETRVFLFYYISHLSADNRLNYIMGLHVTHLQQSIYVHM